MVTLQAFLQGIQENVDRITHYENAGDGTVGVWLVWFKHSGGVW